MKLFKLSVSAVAMALTLGLTACSSDEPVQNNGVAKVDETHYMAITLTSPRDGARAFENGTTNENAVNRLDFLFYDTEGNPTAEPQTFVGEDLKGSDFSDNASGSNVARVWTSVVPVSVKQGENLPAQVVCLVNASADRATVLKGRTLSELIGITDGTFFNNDHFTMVNSVYYGTNVLTGAQNDRICATPINMGQLFGSPEEALEVITNNSEALMVDIYVERSSAKVGLTLNSANIYDFTLDNGDTRNGSVTISFRPEFWFVNGTDKLMYTTKRYGIPGAGTSINMDPTYAEINANFANTGMTNTWNASTLHRSYWACSPSYAANDYPFVSDNVNDLSGNTHAYTLNYYSYNEVKNFANDNGLGKKAIPYTDGFAISNTGNAATGYIYTFESTTSIARIRDVAHSNPAATVTSAVIVGHYVVDGNDAANFWIDTNNGENGTIYFNESKVKSVLAQRNSFIYRDAAGTQPVTDASVFKLMHPVKNVRDILGDNIAGRLVTLQLADVPATPVYYYNGTSFVQVTTGNLANANAQLAAVGYVDMYNNGRAFFNIPIRHLGWPSNDRLADGTELYADGNYNWEAMRVGDLGVVRNHVYTINVNSIRGLGIGLRSDDQPIVPPVNAYKQYVAVRLNVLAWNIVPTQNVEL